jgi:general secretion pathway protein C
MWQRAATTGATGARDGAPDAANMAGPRVALPAFMKTELPVPPWARRLMVTLLCAVAAPPVLAAPRPSSPTDTPRSTALDTAIKRTGELSYEIDLRAAEAALTMSSLTRSARIVPEIREGKATGFRLYSVRPEGALAKLGLQTGDIVRSIDGVVISSPEVALALYEKFKSAGQVSLALDRRGRPLIIQYRIRR